MLATVLRTGQVLALFDPGHPERSLSEVAEALGAPRSTVHALLKTLCRAGLLRRTASRRYALGPRLYDLAADLFAGEPALRRVWHGVEELARTWGGVARVVVGDAAWGPVEVVRAEAHRGREGSGGWPHRCQAVLGALSSGREAATGCWCDLELSRPGWCCVAAVVRGSCGAVALDLCLPAGRFYADAARVRSAVLRACGYREPHAVPVALPRERYGRGQLAR